jgi:hypothetical protein
VGSSLVAARWDVRSMRSDGLSFHANYFTCYGILGHIDAPWSTCWMAKILNSRPWSQICRMLAASAALFEVMIRKFVNSFILAPGLMLWTRMPGLHASLYIQHDMAPTPILLRSFHACIIFDMHRRTVMVSLPKPCMNRFMFTQSTSYSHQRLAQNLQALAFPQSIIMIRRQQVGLPGFLPRW